MRSSCEPGPRASGKVDRPREGPNRAEGILDAPHHTGCVRAIPDQGGIIRCDGELRIHASARHLLNNDLLVLYVALQSQITPPMTKARANVHNKRRIAKMLK